MPERARTEEIMSFTMPSLGADMDEGSIVEWRVAPGDEVRRGDVVAIVETDKSDLDVEVFVDGVVRELVVQPGVRVPVGTVLATIVPSRGAPSAGSRRRTVSSPGPRAGSVPRQEQSHTEASSLEPVVAAADRFTPPAVASRLPGPPPTPAPPIRSPMLRHLAEDLHVDVSRLSGSGRGGSVTRDDIERAGHHRPRVSPRARRLAAIRGIDLSTMPTDRPVTGDAVLDWAARSAAPSTPEPERPSDRSVTGHTGSPSDPMRTAIARQMLRAWQEIPHFQVATTIELSSPLAALAVLNEHRTAVDRVLPAAIFVRAAALAAAQVPGVNGWWRHGQFEAAVGVHVGVVIALRRGGLLVPVLHDAQDKDLDTLMAEMRDLVTRARAGRLKASEMAGASITVTQLGDGEVDTVVPIIHPPQVSILGLGAVHSSPWVVGDSVVVRPVIRAVLAADHRAVDGRLGSAFLVSLDRQVQEQLAEESTEQPAQRGKEVVDP
jgi:pyruvate dehydrogenase E2 component (dihydrolipoamide acetyltransferase)